MTTATRNEQLALPQLVDIKTMAAHLDVGVRHMRRLVAERRIPYVKWGHLIRFDLEEVAAWIDHARIAPQHPEDRPGAHGAPGRSVLSREGRLSSARR